MAFAPYGITWPTLASFQCQYQGNAAAAVVLGGGNSVSAPFNIQPAKMEGFDLQTVGSGDPNRARQRGQYIGLNLMAGRDITLTMDVGPALGSYSSTVDALNHLRAITNAAATDPASFNSGQPNTNPGETEWPFWVKFPTNPLVASMARPIKRNIPIDLSFSLGNSVKGCAVQWHATDPYFYAVTQETTANAATLPSYGSLMPDNLGDVECWPQWTVTGACINPQLENYSLGASLFFNGLSMSSGDTLVVDNDLRTATYTPVSTGIPTSVIYLLNTGWSWWPIIPGTNDIRFSAASSVGAVAMDWASAYSSAI